MALSDAEILEVSKKAVEVVEKIIAKREKAKAEAQKDEEEE